jgi:cytochrome c-type biogenesis protein
MDVDRLRVVETREVSHNRLRYSFTLIAIALVVLLGYLEFEIFLRDIMPAYGNYSLYLLAVVAAVATFFSPCSFPLLPGYLSFYYKTEQPEEGKRALYRGIFAAGGVVTFTLLLGVVIAVMGQGIANSFSVSSPTPSVFTRIFRIGLGVVLLSLGATQLSNVTFHNPALDALIGRLYWAARSGDKGLYLYGFGYNAAGIGCAAPIMAGLVVFALGAGSFVTAFLAFLIYSLTMASLMLGISLLVAKSRVILINILKSSTPKIKKASSIILIAVGTFLIYATINLQFFVQTFFPK